MKILTVLGTRPEIIRLSLIIPKLDQLTDHILVNTGQNFDNSLNEIFFKDLNLRKPDYNMGIVSATPMEQVAKILTETEKIIRKEKPERLLILGDTNSALSAIAAKRMGIPVYHMEAGNRCYDDRVPEEVNRRIIDHSSDMLLPYTERSRDNLLREGIAPDRIFVTGNPIKEVLDFHDARINASNVLERLSLKGKKYFLVTLHRAENVDILHRLKKFIAALNMVSAEFKMPVICSLHPRTKSKLKDSGIDCEKIIMIEPQGLFDFVCLEKNAKCVLSDSGTVQEECCIFNIPTVTLRDVTERPETLECGSNMLSGCEPEMIKKSIKVVLENNDSWIIPGEYTVPNVSMKIAKIILGYKHDF
ncbi:MAG: hypothetical protein ACD_79C00281G0002 [uncultured bacterium]|nr:MAG: hypothetical protein ACD_79C00281G0002 [uncultured bacterium]